MSCFLIGVEYSAIRSHLRTLLGQSLIAGIAVGITNGMGILYSTALGVKDEKKKSHVLASSIVLTALIGIIVTITSEFLISPLLVFVNTDSTIFTNASDYLHIYVVGTIAIFGYSLITTILRAMGNVRFQTICMLVTGILNAILDPIFIKNINFEVQHLLLCYLN